MVFAGFTNLRRFQHARSNTVRNDSPPPEQSPCDAPRSTQACSLLYIVEMRDSRAR